MRKFDFSYDEENDDLFLFRTDAKSKGSVEFGDRIVLDFNNNKELVGLEFLDASQTIADLLPERKEALSLKNLRDCRVEIREKAGITIVRLFLLGKAEEVPAMITVPRLAR